MSTLIDNNGDTLRLHGNVQRVNKDFVVFMLLGRWYVRPLAYGVRINGKYVSPKQPARVMADGTVIDVTQTTFVFAE